MNFDEAKTEIEDLRKYIEKCNYHYYVLNEPLISDKEFDDKMEKLIVLENKFPEFYSPLSPTQRVGSDLTKEFQNDIHDYQMLSLANSYSEEDVESFYEKLKSTLGEEFEIVCELKFDGASISLSYDDAKLNKGVTRGDGLVGDNVTNNIKTIKTIPLNILDSSYKNKFIVRGEIVMNWDTFNKLNVLREKDGETLFANPRNAAAGTLKLQSAKIVSERNLETFIYSMLGDNLPCETHYECLMKAKEWGFNVSPHIKVCKSLQEIKKFISYWNDERHNLSFPTDGVVLKVNSTRQQQELGNTSKFPRWAIAYKFKAEEAVSKLIDVSYYVGRTGVITPVANLEPVLISGSIVKRASLYNEDFISQIDLHNHDYCIVEKGGEIIPKVTAIKLDKREENSKPIKFITNCPSCNTLLLKNQGEAMYYCPNELGCPPQIMGKIEHFMSRKAMNIVGGGPETVEALYKAGLVNNFSDLYDLKKEQLIELDRWGDKKANNFIEGINQSKNIPYHKVIYALGIKFVGEVVAKKIAKVLSKMSDLENATLVQLLNIDEVGDKIAESIINYFNDDKNKIIIDSLRKAGLQMESDNINENISDKFNHKTFVISGVFEKYSREEYKKLIEKNGGKLGSSITSKTDYFLIGDKVGPSKLEKAKKNGIKFINEDDFLSMLM